MDLSSRIGLRVGPRTGDALHAFFHGVAEVHQLTPGQLHALSRTMDEAIADLGPDTEVLVRVIAADRALFVSLAPAPSNLPSGGQGVAVTKQDDAMIVATSRHAA
ncbi:MAG: hypothetical protein ACLGH3_00825 [Actinomycetota bacterium]